MALTTTTGANAIREAYEPGFNEAVFRNNSLMSLFNWTESPGDTAHRWKLNSAGNDSVEVFTENGVQPAAGNQTWVNAALPWTYFRGMAQVTGHARDALRSRWIDAIDEEFTLLRADLVDLITTSFMYSTYGLELAVDFGAAYAGITRNGAAGYFESTETDVAGAISTDDLLNLMETIRDNDKGGQPDVILVPHNQATRIYNLAGPHTIFNANPSDKAPGLMSQTFNNIPIVALPDWTDTVAMALDRRPGNWGAKIHRPFSVKEMAPVNDSDVYQVSWAGCLACHQPKFQGKLTGLTA